MKLAVVCPPSDTVLLHQSHLGFHLAEAHWLEKDKGYLAAYQRLGRLGHFIIVDNGASDGVELDFDIVVRDAHLVHASEIVMPDRMKDSLWTIKHTIQGSKLVDSRMRMIVPQGETPDEWKKCLKAIDDTLHGAYATIGIAKHCEEYEGGRVGLIEHLFYLGYTSHRHVHLLGLSGKLGGVRTELERFKRFPWIRSIDTGAPVAFAQHGVYVDIHRVHFSLAWDDPLTTQERQVARSNIKKMVEILNE